MLTSHTKAFLEGHSGDTWTVPDRSDRVWNTFVLCMGSTHLVNRTHAVVRTEAWRKHCFSCELREPQSDWPVKAVFGLDLDWNMCPDSHSSRYSELRDVYSTCIKLCLWYFKSGSQSFVAFCFLINKMRWKINIFFFCSQHVLPYLTIMEISSWKSNYLLTILWSVYQTQRKMSLLASCAWQQWNRWLEAAKLVKQRIDSGKLQSRNLLNWFESIQAFQLYMTEFWFVCERNGCLE